MKEIRKQKKKRKKRNLRLTGQISAQVAQQPRHPRRLVRPVLWAAHVGLSPREPARVPPIFFYFPD
jgi:hypothetical protein